MPDVTGGGTSARTLALLWRTTEPSSRGPKPGLDIDRIARAAVELADAEGVAALSMRRVAEQLGVGTMSLYTYVPGKAELLDIMVDAVLAEAAAPIDAADWRTGLERVARRNWALYQRHPWLLQIVTNRAVLGPNVIAKYDAELRVVDGIGLSDLEMDAVLTLVLGFVEGAARRAIEVTELPRRTGMTDDQWWAQHAPLLAQVFDVERFPVAARVGAAAGEAYQAPSDPQRAFEFGLARVLDGIATFVASRSG